MNNQELEREIVELPDRSCDLSQKIAIERTSKILSALNDKINLLEARVGDLENFINKLKNCIGN